MTGREWTEEISTLERVRARIEATLRAKADCQVPEGTGEQRSARDKSATDCTDSAELGAWRQIGEAIDKLRSIQGETGKSEPRAETRGPDAPDDLTRIRGIDSATARRLASLGTARYAHVAAWSADDVRRVSRALGLTREISRRNWIEQAALLEHRKTESGIQPALPVRVGMANSTLQDAASQVGLPEILESIRKHRSAPGSAPAIAPTRSAASEPSIPIVPASTRVSPEPTERADDAPLLDADEAAVTFVIREPARLQRPTVEPPLTRAMPGVRTAFQNPGTTAPRDAPILANEGYAEEAEVVVVRPQTQIHYGSLKTTQESRVRRFLKALTGG